MAESLKTVMKQLNLEFRASIRERAFSVASVGVSDPERNFCDSPSIVFNFLLPSVEGGMVLLDCDKETFHRSGLHPVAIQEERDYPSVRKVGEGSVVRFGSPIGDQSSAVGSALQPQPPWVVRPASEAGAVRRVFVLKSIDRNSPAGSVASEEFIRLKGFGKKRKLVEWITKESCSKGTGRGHNR